MLPQTCLSQFRTIFLSNFFFFIILALFLSLMGCTEPVIGIPPDTTPVYEIPTSTAPAPAANNSPINTPPAPTKETVPTNSATTPTAGPTAEETAATEGAAHEEVTAEAIPVVTLEPTPDLPGVYRGIWISTEELAQLPTSGPAWENLKSTADQKVKKPDLGDQDDDSNVTTLAKALVYARTEDADYREDVRNAIEYITTENTEKGGRTLALGRELVAYVVAADLINLPEMDPELDQQFREKLADLLTKKLDGRTLTNTNEERPNNWGTHAGASRAAIAVYLWDLAELEKTAQVFKGWMGDRETYSNFEYGSMTWQCNARQPVGINPAGCTKDGVLIDGSQPEEMRRGGSFQWPPKRTGYAWEALQGAMVQAAILNRAGYDVWEWEDRALLRAVEFLYAVEWEPEGDDQWLPWLINYFYNTDYPTVSPVRAGKNMGFTDWTHASQNSMQALTESN